MVRGDGGVFLPFTRPRPGRPDFRKVGIMSKRKKRAGRRKQTPSSLTLEQAWKQLLDQLRTMADETCPTSAEDVKPTRYSEPLFPGHPVFDAVQDVENVLHREGMVTRREELPRPLRPYWRRLLNASRCESENMNMDELSDAAQEMAEAVKAQCGNWTRHDGATSGAGGDDEAERDPRFDMESPSPPMTRTQASYIINCDWRTIQKDPKPYFNATVFHDKVFIDLALIKDNATVARYHQVFPAPTDRPSDNSQE